MTASEIVKSLSPAARAVLAEVPGYPVKVGAVVPFWGHTDGVRVKAEIREAGVIGPRGGLSIRGAVVVDKIKAATEAF